MIVISKKNCENCNEEYLNEKKYCPNCGVKNSDYVESSELKDNIKTDIQSSDFYEKKIDEEIKNVDNVSFKNKTKNKFNSWRVDFENTVHKRKEDNNKPCPGKGHPKNKIVCPKCETLNELDARFCGKCSFPLKDIKICPSCGFISEHGDIFCGECGHKLSEIKLCPGCNKIMEINAEFCGVCGHKF